VNAIKKSIPIEFHRASEEWKRKASRSMRIACEQGYSSDEDNIGNISRFGSIIFSPPYFDALSITKSHHKSKFAIKKKLPTHYSLNAKNIGNIPNFGSIIFSPPYLNSVPFHDVNFALDNRKVGDTRNCNYGSDPNNIGNLQKFGSIVFSPPLGEANKGSGIAKKGYKGKYGRDEKLKDRCDKPISKDKNNLSNVHFGKTYLGEMFKVYSECFKVLKSGKFMVVVVKDIQRNWSTIPLGADTVKLCQLVGFKCHDIIINKMYFPSFWMLNLAKNLKLKRTLELKSSTS